jgi:ABC-type transporter Mla MlaB component
MARFAVSYNQRASGQLKPEECFKEQTMHAFRAQAVFVRALSDSNKRMLRLDGDISNNVHTSCWRLELGKCSPKDRHCTTIWAWSRKMVSRIDSARAFAMSIKSAYTFQARTERTI